MNLLSLLFGVFVGAFVLAYIVIAGFYRLLQMDSPAVPPVRPRRDGPPAPAPVGHRPPVHPNCRGVLPHAGPDVTILILTCSSCHAMRTVAAPGVLTLEERNRAMLDHVLCKKCQN